MLNAIIFDFDGVIVESLELNFEIFNMQIPELTMQEFKDWHNGNVFDNKHVERLSFGSDFDFEKEKSRLLKDASPHPIMKESLYELSKNYKLFIITSASEHTISKFLEDNNIHIHFEKIYGKETHRSKVEKFKILFDEYHLKADECIFITDTLGDIIEANKVNVKSIAVSWGFHEIELLKKGNPHKIIYDYKELIKIANDEN